MGVEARFLTLGELSYYDKKIKEYISQENDKATKETLREIINYLQSNPQEASMSIDFNQANTFSSMVHSMGHSAIKAEEALQKMNDILQDQAYAIATEKDLVNEIDARVSVLEADGYSFKNFYYNDLNDVINRMSSVEEKLQELSDTFEDRAREEVKIALEQEKEERGRCREILDAEVAAIPEVEVPSVPLVTKLDIVNADFIHKNTMIEVTPYEVEELFGGDPFERRKIVFKEKERLF